MPKRVKIDWRKKGGKKPDNVVIVARPSAWGNPFKVGDPGVPDAATAVHKFSEWLTPYRHQGKPVHESKMHDFLLSQANIEAIRSDLRGKDLACYCDLDQLCHADVLLEIAN